MARRPVLGGGSLNPFGGAGVDFGAFDISGTDRESSLILTRVEVEWEAGRATNEEYLAALRAYAGTLTANTTQRLNADARVESVQYRVERNVLVAKVDAGTKNLSDLLAYDKSKLTGLNQENLEYLSRLNTYQSTQQAYYSDLEKDVVTSYNDGQMTTAQLNAWYVARRSDPLLADNADLRTNIDTRLHELDGRMSQERDSQAIDDYQKGKMAPGAFIAYATSARSRFAPGTNDYTDWTTRLNDAHDKSLETALLYRYDLSQQYAQLQKFVASSQAPKGSSGGTSTSKSTRTILGTDGAWHTVTTTKTTATPGHAPTAAQNAAYHQRQIEVADAKQQMAQIAKKIAGVGGFVSTQTTINYYTKQATKFAKGSDEWYQIQGKLDDLNDRKHQEAVLAKEGIRISYPKSTSASGGTSGGGSATAKTASGGGSTGGTPRAAAAVSDTANVALNDFMSAIAHVESGGRYTARNKTSGAYGKYQIMPANWSGWAGKYLGNANAPMTPENQEKVAAGKFKDLYKWLGDWRAVAHWWLTGGGDAGNHKDPSGWSASSRRYVDNVMAGLGKGPTSGSSLQRQAAAAPSYGVKAAGTGSKPAAKPKTGTPIGEGPLRVIVGESRGGKGSTPHPVTVGASFPKGLDSEAFKKFYAQYDQAFQSGATEFSVDGPNGTVHYWIGDDILERRDGMREMDELRVNLFRERMKSYSGTPTEITAANQFDGAVENAAKHELMILDTYEQKGTSTGTPEQNASPIGSGIAMLERTTKAIADHIAAADAAMKRGDITTAYGLYQLAADLRAGKDEMIARYSAAAQNDVRAIEKAYGVSREEALGKDASKQLAADLARLGNFGTELEAALSKGDENLLLLQQIIKKDSTGAPVFDESGPGGQLQLADNWHLELQANGTVKPEQSPPSGYDPTTGKQKHDIKGMVRIDYLAGNTTVSAYAKYNTGTVGYLIAPDGVTKVPIMGKTFSRRRDDGTDELWVEDPFHPGKWSSTQIIYKAPGSFTAVTGKNGQQVFKFDGLKDNGQGNGGRTNDGSHYTMQWDEQSGSYVLFRSTDGGLFSQGVQDEELGSIIDGTITGNAFGTSGWARDLSGLSGDDLLFSNLGSPFVGGSAQQYKTWRSNFQSPFKPAFAMNERQSLLDEQAMRRGIQAAPTPIDPQSLYAAEHGLAPVGTGYGTHGEAFGGHMPEPIPTSPTAIPALKPVRSLDTMTQIPTATALPVLSPIKPKPKPALTAAQAPVQAARLRQDNANAAAKLAQTRASKAAAAAKAARDKAARDAAARAAAQHQAITGHAVGHGPLE